MQIILLNFLLLTFFTKSLLSLNIFGFNFAPWDLFLLYPFVKSRLFVGGDLKFIYLFLSTFVIIIIISALGNEIQSLATIGVLLQILRNLFILDFCVTLGTIIKKRSIQRLLFSYAFFIPSIHLIIYLSPFQSFVSEPTIGNYMRLEGFASDPNFFSYSLILLFISGRQKQFITFFPILICVLLSGSRSGLGLLIMAAIFSPAIKYLFLIFAPIIFYVVIKLSNNLGQLSVIFSRPLNDTSRTSFWSEALSLMDSNYLFGNGAKSFVVDIGKFSHNDYLTAYYEYGIAGFFVFSILMIFLVKLPYKFKGSADIVLQASLLAQLLILFLFSYWLYPTIWVIKGVLIGLNIPAESRHKISIFNSSVSKLILR